MAFFGPIGKRLKDQVGNERPSRRDVLEKRPYQLLIFANITRKKEAGLLGPGLFTLQISMA